MYIYSHNLGQPVGPTPQPVIPAPSPERMPNVLPPKTWCPGLPKVQRVNCFPYGPTEVQTSHTEAGLLAPDVVLVPTPPTFPNVTVNCNYLIIRDFGVNWRHLKQSTRSEALLRNWLQKFETDKSLFLRIVGYSDCVGVESNNLHLRIGRARNVFRLLGNSARSRVMAVVAAPLQTYLTENTTPASRAHNRSVVIEIFTNNSQII